MEAGPERSVQRAAKRKTLYVIIQDMARGNDNHGPAAATAYSESYWQQSN
jgi:hypothetical protein